MHVHLREPGQEAKEDIHTGTQAAAAGGITHVVTMANTKPVIDNMAVLRAVQKRVEEDGVVKVSIVGSVSKGLEGEQLSEMGDLSAAGAVAFSDDGHYVEMPISCGVRWNMQGSLENDYRPCRRYDDVQ